MAFFLHLIRTYHALFIWISALSLFFFLASLASLPWLIGKLPEDYFLTLGARRAFTRNRYILAMVGNIAGGVVVIMGIVMLFTPGQGVLTIFAGLVLMDFPGKVRIVQGLVRNTKVREGLNWLRQKGGEKSFQFPSPGDR